MTDSDEDEATEKIEQINAGLARYYQSLGKDYDDIFLKYCEENGFADDSLADEFAEEDATDCMIAQFDTDFPFDPKQIPKSEKSRAQKIVSIMQHCFNNDTAYTAQDCEEQKLESFNAAVSLPEIDSAFFTLDKSDKHSSEKLLRAQVSILYNSGMKTEKTILDIMAVGHKNDIPFINFLADMYSRDMANGVISAVEPAQWLEQQPFITVLRGLKTNSNGVKPAQLTLSAITSYFHRICPRLILPPAYYISDSLELISAVIAQSVTFTNNLAKNGENNLPFQIDHCIALKKAIAVFDENGNDGSGDSDDDDSDCDSNHETHTGNEHKKGDMIGDIQSKLSASNLTNVRVRIRMNDARTNRIYDSGFQQLSEQSAVDSFPRNKRFVTVIDRRSENGDKSNDLYMFVPPRDCSTIPARFVPEWFFNSSATTIIPHTTYQNGKEQKDRRNITAQNKCEGLLLTLSFHVFAEDEIKCYLYVNGQMIRFMPRDITGLLPRIFDMEFKGNHDFVKSKLARDLVTSLTIKDVKFEKFRKYVSSQKKAV